MTRSFARFALAASLVAGIVSPLAAATPTFWQVSSQADLLRGDLQGLAIDSDGRLTLGPEIRLAGDTTAPMVWKVLVNDDGSVLAATGNDGKVFRLAPDGTVTTAFDAAELQVQALAPAADGGFYAGTSPDGKVYRVGRTGAVTEVFDPDDKYIWALEPSPDGSLYVATGEKGVIYRVDKDGKAAPFYRTRATNVTALALDSRGGLLAGTSAPGQVLRIDAQGRGFVLLESSFPEVRALRLDAHGNLFVVTVAAGAAPAPAPERPVVVEPTQTTPVASVSTEVTITAIGDISTGAGAATAVPSRIESRREAVRGAIYRIAPDGLWDTFWEATEDVPYDILLEPDGAVLVATGNKGRLLRLAGDPVRVTVVARAEAQQVTSLARGRQHEVLCGTANPGKVLRMGAGTVSEGTYESDVRDASSVASWGVIRWQATAAEGTAVRLFTRSGNTGTPDDTWSPWSAAYARREGEPIASPKARYLQWKATLTGKGRSPVLSSVTVAYLPRNSRPIVSSITVHPPGIAFGRPFPTGDPEIAGYDNGTAEARPQVPAATPTAQQGTSGAAVGRRMYQKGLQTFVWKADDEPGDRLQFDVYYRRQGTREWVPLRRGLWDAIFTWDTTAAPDGTYTVRVVASDAPSNAAGTALSGEAESEPFEIDNTAPVVSVTGVRSTQGRTIVAFTVTDDHSPLDRVEYALDGTRWRTVYPLDGIADSREEQFEVTLDPGVTLPVTIRAVDALNNVGSSVAAAPAGAR